MSKLWLIARHHFQHETARRSFLIVLFSLPLFLTFSVGMGLLIERLSRHGATLGYVDRAGLLVNVQTPSGQRNEVRLAAYDTPEAAAAALDAGKIDAYYVLLADYRQTNHAEVTYRKPPSAAATRVFYNVVRQNLLAGQPAAVIERVLSGADVTMRSLDAHRDYPDKGPSAGQVLPAIAAVIFTFLILTTSGYMLQALVSEKENRTIEVIVSSVSPAEMMGGKIVGAIGIALLQLAVWLIFLTAAVWGGGNVLDVAWLRTVQIGWRDLLLLVIVALPAYFCIAALMTLIGTMMGDGQEAQQASGLFFMPLFLPIYLIIPLAQHPSGPLAVGMSLFPLTAVMTLGMRSIFLEVALWEYGLAAVIALACGLGTVWLAARAFRAAMLRYGQHLDLRKVIGGARSV
ncbi:MAG: ABC transporter permease [Chloroflexi bacterium]|nr:ABC transporter permease [Chloroflexota bacterium]